MGMNYIIGYNRTQSVEKQVAEFGCSSYVHSLLNYLIVRALKSNYNDLYNDITVNEGIHLIQFDELSKKDFMAAIFVIRNFIKNGDESIAENAEIWNLDIEPLIIIDERYDPSFENV